MATRYNITIDHTSSAHNSDRSHSESSQAYTDEEDSNGAGTHLPSPRSAVGSHNYSEHSDPVEGEEGSWDYIGPDEIGPSDSASRPRTSNQHRHPAPEAPQPNPARRQPSHRPIPHERLPYRSHPRTRAPPPPSNSESVDQYEDWAPGPTYVQAPPQPAPVPVRRAYWSPVANNPAAAYANSYSSAPGYAPYPHTSGVPPGGQLVPFGSPAPYGSFPYQTAGVGGPNGYFPPAHHISPMAHPTSAYNGQERIHHPPGAGYFPYPQGHPVPQPIPAPVYPQFVQVYTPSPPAAAPAPATTPAPAQPTPPPSAPAAETPKDDERFARLEQILIDERTDREQREAAAKKAAEEAAAKAEADRLKAEEIAAASSAAAAAAKREAEDKAAEDAAKAKEEAEAAKAAAVAEATPAPAPPPPPEERKKPIKFKDAVGRKFQFPFHLCNTWMVCGSCVALHQRRDS